MNSKTDWTDEHNDWADELDQISQNIQNKSSDLRSDTYAVTRSKIIQALETNKSKLEFVIESLKQLSE